MRNTVEDDASSRPLVSVIVLSFNRCEETLDCLKALTQQTHPDIELIVLDNASRDNSVREIASKYPFVTLLRMPRNYGDWEARDIALLHCHGEFIMLVDSDAVVPCDAVEKLVNALEVDGSLAAVQPALQDPQTERLYDAGFGRDLATKQFYKAVFHGCTVVFRAEALRAAGGFPHLLLGGGEDFLSFRFYDMGYRVLYLPDVVVQHMMSPKERILKHRLMYQSVQKLRAQVTHVPGVGRLVRLIVRSLSAYTYHNARFGHITFFPIGIWKHTCSVIAGLLERRPIASKSMELIDQLKSELVATDADFAAIDNREIREGITSASPGGVSVGIQRR